MGCTGSPIYIVGGAAVIWGVSRGGWPLEYQGGIRVLT